MSTEDLDILRRLLQNNQELCVMLEQRCTEISPAPGTSIQESFIIRDVLGREYRCFQHWEIFAAILKCVFMTYATFEPSIKNTSRTLIHKGTTSTSRSSNLGSTKDASMLGPIHSAKARLVEAGQCDKAIEKPSMKLQKEGQEPIHDRNLVVMPRADGIKNLLHELPKVDSTQRSGTQRIVPIDPQTLWYCGHCHHGPMSSRFVSCCVNCFRPKDLFGLW